jgi:hypothetical protein
MKALICIVIVVVVVLVFKEVFLPFYERSKRGEVATQTETGGRPGELRGEDLAGLPTSLEASLQTAQGEGAKAMGEWLQKYRTYAKDPRLAWIELDYVVLVSLQDAKEARRVFQGVKERTPPNSPVFERVKKLEKTYQ